MAEQYLKSIGVITLDSRRSLLCDVRLNSETLSLNLSPESKSISFNLICASFGPILNDLSISGKAVLPINKFADSALTNVEGCIVFLRRGVVSFVSKALRAQEAGAAAVIIMQTYEMWPFVMTNAKKKTSLFRY